MKYGQAGPSLVCLELISATKMNESFIEFLSLMYSGESDFVILQQCFPSVFFFSSVRAEHLPSYLACSAHFY